MSSPLGVNLFQSTSLPVLEQVVNFTQVRHNVLAGNIANLDTPGYETKDISPQDFQKQLKAAIKSRDEESWNGGLEETEITKHHPRHENPIGQVSKSLSAMLRHDQGNVGLEQQMTEITKNQMQHNLAVTIMTSQFRLLQAAISEKV